MPAVTRSLHATVQSDLSSFIISTGNSAVAGLAFVWSLKQIVQLSSMLPPDIGTVNQGLL